MKAWLKGGLVGGGIIFVLEIINLIFLSPLINLTFYLHRPFLFILVAIFGNTGNFPGVLFFSGEFGEYASIFGFIIVVGVFFLLGAFIGWIIGRIKARKEKQNGAAI